MAQQSPAPFTARNPQRIPTAPAITVRLTDAERSLLDAAAQRAGMNRSEYVRAAIGAAVVLAIDTGGPGV